MRIIFDILSSTLRTAFFNQPLSPDYVSLSADEWKQLFGFAVQQGVSAIVYDVVSQLPKEQQPPRNLNIQWALSAESVEKRYELQCKTSKALARLYAEQNIKTVVLKGLAISTYYPIPNHRECGDLDCFLCGDYEKGNKIAEDNSAEVKRDYYKHSHIHFRGLFVENHQFCVPIRGNKQLKRLERYLEQTIADETILTYFDNSHLIIPPPTFNALFLTAHAFGHFLSEGIKLRHICDWACLLEKEQNSIDWGVFYDFCEKLHYSRFADALTVISVDYLGLQITNPAIHTESEYADRVLEDVLFNNNSLFNRGYSAWKSRLLQIKNKFSFTWKYHKIYQKSVVAETLRAAFAFFFEKTPKL